MNNKLSGLLVLAALLLAACGSEPGKEAPPPPPPPPAKAARVNPDNFQNGSCGSNVIGDYNLMVIRCKYLRSGQEATACKTSTKAFLAKYPTISCQARPLDATSADERTVMVQAAELKKVVERITEWGF